MFFRGTLYFCLGLVPFLVGDAIDSALDSERLGVTNYLPGQRFYVDVISIAALMVVAMVLRFCAQRAEESRHGDEEQSRLTLRRGLLFYAFTPPAARIVRILFYIWTVFAIVLAIGLISDVIDEPRAIVSGAVQFVGIIGYALALCYWAASLDARANGRVSSKASSSNTVEPQPG
jgi:hypothetical protein